MNKKLTAFLANYWILLSLILIKFIMQYVLLNPTYELHRDEFLHLNQALHPAAGYISVPPFTSWIASIIYLLGGDMFWIRFFPALFGALMIVFTWLIVETLGGKLMAKLLAVTYLLFSVYMRLNVLFQPNAFDYLAWTAMFYFLIRYIQNNEIKWLYYLSLATVLGMYNKYTVLFMVVGLAVGLILTKERIIFSKKHFYWAIGLAILLFLPNLIWQITHHFPVILHMQVLNDSQLANISRLGFLIDQLKYGVMGILTLAALWAFLRYEPFRPYRSIGLTFVVVMVLFTMARAKSYYSLGLYPVMFAFGSVFIEHLFKKWRVAVITTMIILNIIAFFAIVKYLMPFQSPVEIIANQEAYERIGLLRWEDGRNHPLPQDFADMVGWKEMSDKAFAAYQMIPEDERSQTLIYCDNYGQTGALNYYNLKRMPEAYSYSTDHIFWIPPNLQIKNIVFVGELPDQRVMDLFAEYKLIGTVDNEFSREQGTKIFLLLDAKPGTTELFYKNAETRKQNFDYFN